MYAVNPVMSAGARALSVSQKERGKMPWRKREDIHAVKPVEIMSMTRITATTSAKPPWMRMRWQPFWEIGILNVPIM